MNGIIVIDKPGGVSSAQVVGTAKRMLKAKKVGHTGTLDPFATGVLVCCVNQATRLSQFFMEGEKSYHGVMHLGIRTDTQDATGQVQSEASTLEVTAEQIETVFRDYAKSREQVPPPFSALKHQGVPLYKLARKGIFVQKPSRPIAIYQLALVGIDLPMVQFQVRCSQGTYIRTLCSDIGDALGCGAHLVQLRRTESGGFSIEDAISLEALQARVEEGTTDRCVIPMREALKGIPEIEVDYNLAQWIRHGRPINEDKLGPVEEKGAEWVKVTDGKNLIAILAAKGENGFLPYKCVFNGAEGQSVY